MSKGTLVGIGLCAVFIGVVWYNNRETDDEKAAKPGTIAALVDNSAQSCKHSDSDAHYKERLAGVLQKTHQRNLKTLHDNNVTICLDTRLTNQTLGFFDKRIEGALYRNTPSNATATIWDDGSNENKVFGRDVYDYGPQALSTLAEGMRSGSGPAADNVFFAYHYEDCSTDSDRHQTCTTETAWKPRNSFDQDTVAKNPSLLQAPRVPGKGADAPSGSW